MVLSKCHRLGSGIMIYRQVDRRSSPLGGPSSCSSTEHPAVTSHITCMKLIQGLLPCTHCNMCALGLSARRQGDSVQQEQENIIVSPEQRPCAIAARFAVLAPRLSGSGMVQGCMISWLLPSAQPPKAEQCLCTAGPTLCDR